jgi:3',5'-cyclic-AMP phosphodiesterase
LFVFYLRRFLTSKLNLPAFSEKYLMEKKYCLRLFSILFFVSLLHALCPCSAHGASTLYERSLEKFRIKAEKASAKEFAFVVLGDSRDNDRICKQAFALAARFNPLFILHTGDVSNTGSKKELAHFLDLAHDAIPDIPLFVAAGNHDFNDGKKLFEQTIGPLNYMFESLRLNIRVIVLDNTGGSLKPGQIDYLRSQLLNRQALTFVALHIPPKTKRWTWHAFSDGADALQRTLSASSVALAFFGHIHQYDVDEINGVKYIVTGGAGAPLNRFFLPGKPVYHIIVVKVKDGTVSYTVENVPE